jgi:hypothetical protein
MRSPSTRPSTVMSRGSLSHCGGMAKRNMPSVNSILAIGRALPPDRTNCPTRVAVPDRSTSSHEGDVCVPRWTTRSHRPSSASDVARDWASVSGYPRGREHQRGTECDTSDHHSSSVPCSIRGHPTIAASRSRMGNSCSARPASAFANRSLRSPFDNAHGDPEQRRSVAATAGQVPPSLTTRCARSYGGTGRK